VLVADATASRSDRTARRAEREEIESPATYRVRPGDSLWRIADAELGDPGRWPEIYRLNRGTIDSPDLLQPGWVLRLPPQEPGGQ
jgi:nucleoid-associated protein YgaU